MLGGRIAFLALALHLSLGPAVSVLSATSKNPAADARKAVREVPKATAGGVKPPSTDKPNAVRPAVSPTRSLPKDSSGKQTHTETRAQRGTIVGARTSVASKAKAAANPDSPTEGSRPVGPTTSPKKVAISASATPIPKKLSPVGEKAQNGTATRQSAVERQVKAKQTAGGKTSSAVKEENVVGAAEKVGEKPKAIPKKQVKIGSPSPLQTEESADSKSGKNTLKNKERVNRPRKGTGKPKKLLKSNLDLYPIEEGSREGMESHEIRELERKEEEQKRNEGQQQEGTVSDQELKPIIDDAVELAEGEQEGALSEKLEAIDENVGSDETFKTAEESFDEKPKKGTANEGTMLLPSENEGVGVAELERDMQIEGDEPLPVSLPEGSEFGAFNAKETDAVAPLVDTVDTSPQLESYTVKEESLDNEVHKVIAPEVGVLSLVPPGFYTDLESEQPERQSGALEKFAQNLEDEIATGVKLGVPEDQAEELEKLVEKLQQVVQKSVPVADADVAVQATDCLVKLMTALRERMPQQYNVIMIVFSGFVPLMIGDYRNRKEEQKKAEVEAKLAKEASVIKAAKKAPSKADGSPSASIAKKIAIGKKKEPPTVEPVLKKKAPIKAAEPVVAPRKTPRPASPGPGGSTTSRGVGTAKVAGEANKKPAGSSTATNKKVRRVPAKRTTAQWNGK